MATDTDDRTETVESNTADTPAARSDRRRVVFPWVWLILLGVARLAVQTTELTVDFKNIATLATVLLAVSGLGCWYLIRGRRPLVIRLAAAAAPFIAAFAFLSFFELKFRGDGSVQGVHRRGEPKPDELLAAIEVEDGGGLADWGPGPYDYPRFLGSGPWASAVGPSLAADWSESPPEELWRRPIGAGWSSFAVYGPYAVTQEQRGEEELVVCYKLLTGEPVWSHTDPIRYLPDNAAGEMGRAGPRATPTIVADRVYTQGATGFVNCLDGRTGAVVWSVDTAERFGADVAVWGKSGSPLFVQGSDGDAAQVIVNVGAPSDWKDQPEYSSSLVAFDAQSGEVRWSAGNRQTSYASPQLIALHGQPVVVQTSDLLLSGRDAATGELLLERAWSGTSENMPTCSQPVAIGENRLLMTKGYGFGSTLLEVRREDAAWSLQPVWDPPIKPVLQTKYSNVVVRDGYAFGLNGDRLQCVDVATGERMWRKRRRPSFGFGQVLLAGEHLIVSTEAGEIVQILASPEKYEELGSLQALAEDEVCWNNPVIVGDVLIHRNAVEAVAYRLPLGEGEPVTLTSTKRADGSAAALDTESADQPETTGEDAGA
ncbi:MAG: PQQ-binding-like beta-propeller repeat protein [Planctomycetota bacterium]